jgi:hypothetical protein
LFLKNFTVLNPTIAAKLREQNFDVVAKEFEQIVVPHVDENITKNLAGFVAPAVNALINHYVALAIRQTLRRKRSQRLAAERQMSPATTRRAASLRL